MKKIEHIRNNYNVIIEKQDTDTRKLEELSHSGLFEANKLPIVKRALEKDPAKLTIAERKVMVELLDSLLAEAYNQQELNEHKPHKPNTKEYLSKYDPRFGTGWPTERDIPTVIILKRKAIRVYPDNQKIALYYSQYLDKYVSIPFGPGKHVGIPVLNEALGVDYQTAYKDYKNDYDDDAGDKVLKDPNKLKKFVQQKAAEGKIRAKHYQKIPGGESSSSDAERTSLRKAAQQHSSWKNQVTSGGRPISSHLGAKFGLGLYKAIKGLTRGVTGKEGTISKPKSLPPGHGPWGQKQPTTSSGVPVSGNKNVRPPANVSAPAKTPTPAASASEAPKPVEATPKKVAPNKFEKRYAKAPGTGEQPSVSGNLPSVDKTKTFSAPGTPKIDRVMGREISLPNFRPAGTGPQPSIKVGKPKAALQKKLAEMRQLDEIAPVAMAAAPVLAAGALAIGAYHAAKHLAHPKNRKDIGQAIDAGVQGVKNTWDKASDLAAGKSKEAEAERAGEAQAGAAYDAKKEQIKRQRADDRDAAEVAANSGFNPKNRTKVEPKTAPVPVTPPALAPTIAKPEPSKSVPAPAKVEVEVPKAQTAEPKVSNSIAIPTDDVKVISPPKPVSIPGTAAPAAPGVESPAKPIDQAIQVAAAQTATQTKETSGTKVDAKADTRSSTKPATGSRLPRLNFSGDDNDTSKTKLLSPAAFGLKASVSKDSGNVTTGVDKRMSNLYRKSFEKSINEEPDANTSTSSVRSARFLAPAQSSLKVSVSAPKSKYRTGVDARVQKYERDYYIQQNENVIKTMKKMVSEGLTEMSINIGENPITINNTIAQKIVSVHESLNKDNKKQLENMLNESVESFKKIVNFAVRQ